MSVHEEEAARLLKLERLKKAGVDPFPARAKRSHVIAAVRATWDTLLAANEIVTIAGRIRAKRGHGGILFAQIEDESGKIQIAFKKDVLGAESFQFFDATSDIGDFFQIEGTLFTTKLGEQTALVSRYQILAKALEPLPEKWHGLEDVEVRYRRRYLDLIANEQVRGIFKTRSAIIKAIREFFDERGFMEVETPILQPLAGGAAAEPFVTHHNALDIDLYLRIAPELYLKRLLVGGFERVYEIARCFRNEGIDHLHNPEFTQIEAYQAYADFNDFMNLVEELLPKVIRSVHSDISAVPFEETTINFEPPYPRVTFRDAVKQHAGHDIETTPDRPSLADAAEKLGLSVADEWGYGKILDELFKKFARPKLLNPTFVTHHPVELSPLAKKDPNSSTSVERFQLLVGRGYELVNAFSELNDPLDQEARFAEQEKARKAGDAESPEADKDFVEALKHGMPPSAGLGLGIDRLAMLLTNSHSIKEVILFPTLRPESKE